MSHVPYPRIVASTFNSGGTGTVSQTSGPSIMFPKNRVARRDESFLLLLRCHDIFDTCLKERYIRRVGLLWLAKFPSIFPIMPNILLLHCIELPCLHPFGVRGRLCLCILVEQSTIVRKALSRQKSWNHLWVAFICSCQVFSLKWSCGCISQPCSSTGVNFVEYLPF